MELVREVAQAAEEEPRRSTRWGHDDSPRRSSPLSGLMENGMQDKEMSRTLTDSRRWLLQTFTTAADLEPTDDIEARTQATTPSPKQSTQELDMSLGLVLQQEELQELLAHAATLEFDAIAFSKLESVARRPLQCLGAWAVKKGIVKTLVSQGKILEAQGTKFQTCFIRFLGEIDGLYDADASYHNSAHAADVVMTMEWILSTSFMVDKVTTLDRLMVMVAASIHDVGHPGRNNLFHIKTMSPLAVTYNDKSVLENMHLAKSFQTMQSDPELNWFALLRPAHCRDDDTSQCTSFINPQQYVRRGLIDMVLATDTAKHESHVRFVENMLEATEGGSWRQEDHSASRACLKQEAVEKKLHLLECILHAADISNPCKPQRMMLQWTEKVLLEFWAQGDEERWLGVEVSPMCDRESGRKSVAKGQLGFITFVIQPYYSPIAELIPEVKVATEQLARNRSFWERMDREQATPEQLFGCDRERLPEQVAEPPSSLA